MSRFPDPPPSAGRRGFRVGRLLAGLVIVAFGIGWLLEALGEATVPWRVVLPAALILIGLALVLSARGGGEHGGLITLGILLTVVLTVGTVVDVPVRGGVGERRERPVAFMDHSYDLAVGKLTVDLRALTRAESGGKARIDAHVGIGQLVVIVPRRSLTVDVRARAGVGEIDVFGVRRSGFHVDYSTPTSAELGPVVVLDASVGIGDVEVRRG